MYRTVKRWTAIACRLKILAFLERKAKEISDEKRPYLKIWKITAGSVPAWVRIKKELLEESPKYFLLSIAYMEEIDGNRGQYRIDILPAPTKSGWEDFLSHVGACSEWREILSRPVIFCLDGLSSQELKKFEELLERIREATSLSVEEVVFISLRNSIREELIRSYEGETIGETISKTVQFVFDKLKEGGKLEEVVCIDKIREIIGG